MTQEGARGEQSRIWGALPYLCSQWLAWVMGKNTLLGLAAAGLVLWRAGIAGGYCEKRVADVDHSTEQDKGRETTGGGGPGCMQVQRTKDRGAVSNSGRHPT